MNKPLPATPIGPGSLRGRNSRTVRFSTDISSARDGSADQDPSSTPVSPPSSPRSPAVPSSPSDSPKSPTPSTQPTRQKSPIVDNPFSSRSSSFHGRQDSGSYGSPLGRRRPKPKLMFDLTTRSYRSVYEDETNELPEAAERPVGAEARTERGRPPNDGEEEEEREKGEEPDNDDDTQTKKF